MRTAFRMVSLGVGGISLISVVLLVASGVAALFGNRATSEQLFVAVFGTWLALALAAAFVYSLHYFVSEE
jgi:uncharacterized membrane protein